MQEFWRSLVEPRGGSPADQGASTRPGFHAWPRSCVFRRPSTRAPPQRSGRKKLPLFDGRAKYPPNFPAEAGSYGTLGGFHLHPVTLD